MQPSYPIRAVSKITGISLDTLRAWERRYGAVVPVRQGRGRAYGPAEIDRLNLLRRLVQKGHSIGGIASLTLRELERLEGTQSAEAPHKSASVLDPLLTAIDSYDTARAGDEMNRLAAVLAPRDVVYEVALPLMREVGERWRHGRLTVAQEHMVSQLLRGLMGAMLRVYRPSSSGDGVFATLVIATPAGERHEFGILAAAMLASIQGIAVTYLGVDLPANEIAEAARRVGATAVLLGVTVPQPGLTEEVAMIASLIPNTCELWLGGAAGSEATAPLKSSHRLFAGLSGFEDACRLWNRSSSAALDLQHAGRR